MKKSSNFVRNSYELSHKCNVCNTGMREGYVVDGGLDYYCSKACLNTVMTDEKWTAIATGSDYNYYTIWEDEEDLYI